MRWTDDLKQVLIEDARQTWSNRGNVEGFNFTWDGGTL